MKLISINNRNPKRKGQGKNNSSGNGNNGQNSRSGGYKLRRGIQKRWLQFPKYGIKKKISKTKVITLNIISNYLKNKQLKVVNLKETVNSKDYKVLPCVLKHLEQLGLNIIK